MHRWICKGMIGVLALAMAVGAGPLAAAVLLPQGMNLRLNGSEIVGSTEYSILATGQEVVGVSGHFSGDETFTYVQPGSSGATAVCAGSISAGVVTLQSGNFGTLGQGQFTITMTFTPSAISSNTPCDVTDYTLLCNRTLQHRGLVNDLNVGQYNCVTTGVTVNGGAVPASLEASLGVLGGSNSPKG